MVEALRTSLLLVLVMTGLLGGLYPATVWLAGHVLFDEQANGSVISYQGKTVGSALIGQNFSHERYFWPRPSATMAAPYNGLASGASNRNPTHPALREEVAARVAALRAAHPKAVGRVPADLVTASGSGLDPHISLAAALYQAERVAEARKLPIEKVKAAILAHTDAPFLGVLGEPRVNVLTLNIALDGFNQTPTAPSR